MNCPSYALGDTAQYGWRSCMAYRLTLARRVWRDRDAVARAVETYK